jgi:hypothetical protein
MTMNEDDVWNLSFNQQSRPVFAQFSNIMYVYFPCNETAIVNVNVSRSSLLRRLWAANSMDLM